MASTVGSNKGLAMAQTPGLFRCPACGGPVAATAASCPHCGYSPAATTRGTNTAAVGLGLGGLLVAGGSFLPWITVSGLLSVSRNGLDGGGDGLITLGLGIALALVAVASFSGTGLPLWSRALGFLGGLGALAVAIYDGVDVARAAAGISTGLASGSVGAGIFVVGAGGGLAILVALFANGPTRAV